ncbi:MAG: DNA alkylation repair protein [Acidimicrobiales bacterium]
MTTELQAVADPDKAGPMAAYMKTDMAFYGVPSPARKRIVREAKKRFTPADDAEYRDQIETLWQLPHREEKYCAIGVARAHQPHITFDQIDLYQDLVTEGAWWDFVDEIATHLVGRVVATDRESMRPILERWIDGDDLWLRRTAIICRLGHKEHTDRDQLFDFCARRAHEKEFFIRKAIGWALREYAKTDPDAVRAFVAEHQSELSGLSQREATKHL